MPATFAHCLIAQKAIDVISGMVKKQRKQKSLLAEYVQKLAENNHFVIMGAAGPDYPYLTDILTTSIVPISHTWANRMHYENTGLFIKEGVRLLSNIDKSSKMYAIRLAWFCGYVSHVIADIYVHPIVNSIVGGTYTFTHQEHGKCELIQDIYIFKTVTGEDIIISNPRTGSLGYLKILEQCSDPKDENKVNSEITVFWRDLLVAAHPNAKEYFAGIIPDVWHHNYKNGVNFVADPGAIFRHVIGMTGRAYKPADEISLAEREKYISKIKLPNGNTSTYDDVFKRVIEIVTDIWYRLFDDLENRNIERVTQYIRDWNLDTGVDESKIDLWQREA